MLSRYRRLHAREHTRALLTRVARTPQLDNLHVAQGLLRAPAAVPLTPDSQDSDATNLLLATSDSATSHDEGLPAANVCSTRSQLQRRDIPMDGSCMFVDSAARSCSGSDSAEYDF